jgi:pre-mRNA-splicing factor ATP-dependent RNA helicase DHX16
VYDEWAEANFSTSWCFQNFIQVRSMRRARDVREQLVKLMERVELELVSNPHDHANICKAITAGYFYHAASLQRSGNYKTFHKPQTVYVHPSSSLFQQQPKWVMYHELVLTNKEFMRQIIEIDPAWLVETAPHLYKDTDIEKLTKKQPKGQGRAKMT